MDSMPHDWSMLLALVFALGLRHGLDADHLVAIDGFARANARRNPGLSRWCGLLFSLGHGLVVMAVALTVGFATNRWTVPEWLEHTGAWISIAFLLVLGATNLAIVLRTAPGDIVHTVGLKARLIPGRQRAGSPLWVAGAGALFALSFDTVSQASLFALTAAQFGGWTHAVVLGLLFTLGMMIADGCNGLWINRLIRRADQIARITSRIFGLVVSGLSLLLGAFGIAKYSFAPVGAWTEGRELEVSLGVIAIVGGGFLAAAWVARTQPSQVCTSGN